MVSNDIQWAWRNVRARGWRPVLTIGLLGVALAANTLVFSAADSLVFHRTPYRDLHQLVEIQTRESRTGRLGASFVSAPLLDEWRKQTDLFAAVHVHLQKVIFLSGAGEPELVPAADITVGLIELLGMRPRWGRSFVDGDDRPADVQVVLISESLARERFGDPAAAVGRKLETTADPLMIVGVMEESFRYPAGSQRIWRALDPRGPLGLNYGFSPIARLVPGLALDVAAPIVERRSVDIGKAAGARSGYMAGLTPLRMSQSAAAQRRMFVMLVGAALCLLLIACANVASLELASAVARARTFAIQLAVGASKGSLARTALLEGLGLIAASALLAGVLAHAGAAALVKIFPPTLLANSANRIDLDQRALLFMTAIATIAWLMSTLPVVVFASRACLLDLLKLEGHAGAASPGGTLSRRSLTVVQVALAVLLLIGSVLYVRSYIALLRLEKGFDSSGVVAISLTIPPQLLGTEADRRVLAQTILERVRARPGVVAAFEGSPPPSTGDSPYLMEEIEVDDRSPARTSLRLPRLRVEPDYFTVLRIPLVAGRMFEPGEPPTNVIITAALARYLWPDGNAVGHRFRESPSRSWNHVIGVVGHVRTLYDNPTGPDRYFQLYVARQPPIPGPPVQKAPTRFSAISYGFLTVTARIDTRSRASDLFQTVRSVDSRNILKLEFVDDQYARQFADRLLATRIISSFGLLAFVVAAAGVYGLMAFLVADRTREMGIRMALGADAGAISRMVLASSLRLVSIGAILGQAAALAAARWVQSQLFGVRPADPATFTTVSLVVITVALIATWQPARQAARVDPNVLLRN